MDRRHAATIAFDNMRVSADALIGLEDEGVAVLDQTRDIGRNALSAEMPGGIDTAGEFDSGFFQHARVTQQRLGDAPFHRSQYASLNEF